MSKPIEKLTSPDICFDHSKPRNRRHTSCKIRSISTKTPKIEHHITEDNKIYTETEPETTIIKFIPFSIIGNKEWGFSHWFYRKKMLWRAPRSSNMKQPLLPTTAHQPYCSLSLSLNRSSAKTVVPLPEDAEAGTVWYGGCTIYRFARDVIEFGGFKVRLKYVSIHIELVGSPWLLTTKNV